jgi:EAL domain-containing protein (putative c-di-GMP-specific phosphodiesterase class I)
MERGIENREFLVYYQPKHDLPTGMLSGAEALVRWMHPELGFTRPDVFVPLFERNGLIWQLDRYVCEEVCRELARFEAMGLPVVPISINVSPLDFDDHDLPEHVIEMTDRYGIDHSLLHIELTETAYAEDPDNVVHALERLRASGFKIELDDFGSGYSSLSLLNTLPLDIIKIDSGIVRTAARRGDFRIIQSAVHIAQLLGLETVIEGVESEDVLWRLRDLGCDAIQGFYYSWPLRREDFEEYVVSAQS